MLKKARLRRRARRCSTMVGVGTERVGLGWEVTMVEATSIGAARSLSADGNAARRSDEEGVAMGLAAGGVMSAWIWACVRPRLYSRTSSMSPSKYSPQTELPPMRSTPVDVVMDPETAVVPTRAPLT